MKLHIKNTGSLTDTEIEITGITIVAGENNTGKSTFGKVLHALLSSLVNLEQRIDTAKRRLAFEAFRETVLTDRLKVAPWVNQVRRCLLENSLTPEIVSAAVRLTPEDMASKTKTFSEKANAIIVLDKKLIAHQIILDSFQRKYINQFQSLFHQKSNSRIELIFQNKKTEIQIQNGKTVSSSSLWEVHRPPIDVNDCLIARNKGSRLQISDDLLNHCPAEDKDTTVVKELLLNKSLQPVLTRLTNICHGKLEVYEGRWCYVDQNAPDNRLDLANAADGLKPFLILQTLINHAAIDMNDVLIMDSPENHLHPDWQIIWLKSLFYCKKNWICEF